MSRRQKWVIVASCLAAIVTLLALLPKQEEPSYQDQPLSEWITLYSGLRGSLGPAAEHEAAEAIQSIGTNALPYLLEWTAYESTRSWRYKIRIKAGKLPRSWQQRWPVKAAFSGDPMANRAAASTVAFAALGSLAKPAIPELSRRAQQTNAPGTRFLAMAALAYTGSAAVPVMSNIVVNLDQQDNSLVYHCIQVMGTNAEPLVPLMIPLLRSTNMLVSANTARTLGNIQLAPEIVVPALAECMADSRHVVRASAAFALMKFGELARPALPVLVVALGDPDAVVRRNAAQAIIRIDPGAMRNPVPNLLDPPAPPW